MHRPEQLPNLIDRAIRVAVSKSAPTCIIIPSDVFELEYVAPGHAFKQVPSSVGMSASTVTAEPGAVRQAADILNAGQKVALLVGQGARGCVEELTQIADLLGAGAAKALLGKDVLSDDLPWVTGSIGLLGTIVSYKMMMDCDTLLTVGPNFPYTQFLPELDQARAIQIDRSGKWIGMRYHLPRSAWECLSDRDRSAGLSSSRVLRPRRARTREGKIDLITSAPTAPSKTGLNAVAATGPH